MVCWQLGMLPLASFPRFLSSHTLSPETCRGSNTIALAVQQQLRASRCEKQASVLTAAAQHMRSSPTSPVLPLYTSASYQHSKAFKSKKKTPKKPPDPAEAFVLIALLISDIIPSVV